MCFGRRVVRILVLQPGVDVEEQGLEELDRLRFAPPAVKEAV